MSLTKDEITAGATYTVVFEYGALSAKRFRDAVQYAKDAGGQFDGGTKTWTIKIGPAGPEKTIKCQSCVDGGRNGSWAHKRDENGLCCKCQGTQELTVREEPYALRTLRSLADAYHAIVERA